ncbi:hypothetical protein [Desulfosporosinus sp. OT]|nr:hypothetical protein [Desulfosporosinus sp. OT]EGW37300.1 hypothetical protein DOT_4892 [Desulfosporosinus sp. OT]
MIPATKRAANITFARNDFGTTLLNIRIVLKYNQTMGAVNNE